MIVQFCGFSLCLRSFVFICRGQPGSNCISRAAVRDRGVPQPREFTCGTLLAQRALGCAFQDTATGSSPSRPPASDSTDCARQGPRQNQARTWKPSHMRLQISGLGSARRSDWNIETLACFDTDLILAVSSSLANASWRCWNPGMDHPNPSRGCFTGGGFHLMSWRPQNPAMI